MNTSVTDYVDVNVRARELGYSIPDGVAILPANFDSVRTAQEVIDFGETATLRILFREAGLPDPRLQSANPKPPTLHLKFENWFGPTLFFSAAAILGNPQIVNIALGVIANLLTDLFKGRATPPALSCSFVVEQRNGGGFKRINYQGPVEGLKSLGPVVHEVYANEQKPDAEKVRDMVPSAPPSSQDKPDQGDEQ